MSLQLVSRHSSLLLITFLSNIRCVSAEVFYTTWYFGLGVVGLCMIILWLFVRGIHRYKHNRTQVSTDAAYTTTHCHTHGGHHRRDYQYGERQSRNQQAQTGSQHAQPPPEYKSIYPDSAIHPQSTVATYPWSCDNPTPYNTGNPPSYPPDNPTPYNTGNPPSYPPDNPAPYNTGNPASYPPDNPTPYTTGNPASYPPHNPATYPPGNAAPYPPGNLPPYPPAYPTEAQHMASTTGQPPEAAVYHPPVNQGINY